MLLLALGAGCSKTATSTNTPAQPPELTIYTYDSLAADYGLLPKIIPQFEQANNVKVNVVTFPDTGTMLNQLFLEKNDPQADVVLGLDNVNLEKASSEQLFTAELTPFDYGYVGFVYDSEAIQFSEPISLMDLTNEQYKNKIIIEQPGLSSPGTQLLIWSYQALGETQAKIFWDKMKDNVLTVTPDWNTAYYTMFMEGEAPIVLSYLTSPAYHIDQENTERYKAIPIKEGYLKQTEYVAIINNSTKPALAQQWINYMISNSVQKEIPTTQWMWPIDATVSLPAAYSKIITPMPEQIMALPADKIAKNYATWLNDWNTTFNIK